MALGFLSPLFLLGALAAAVPILLHLFRRRADPVVPFSAVRFLRRAPVEQARRRRVRDLVLLALRIAAVVLLALSFARPYLAAPVAAPGLPLTVIALDSSYSVSAPAQAERARALARRAVEEAPGGGFVSVVRFDDRADVLVPPTADRSAARAAIDRWAPGAGGTRYGAAIAAATDLAAGRPARVAIVSDLQQRGWSARSSAALPRSADVSVRDTGGAPGNLGVVALARTGVGTAATIRNQWRQSKTVRVAFTLDGRELGRVPVDVPADSTAVAALRTALPARGVLRAAIADPAGFAADDERYLVLDPPARARIVLVTGEGRLAASSLYLETALAAVDPDEFEIVRWSPRDPMARPWEGSAAVVLLGTSGVDRGVLESIWRAAGSGAGVLVVMGPGVEPERLRGWLPVTVGAPRTVEGVPLSVAPADVRHPAFRSVEGDAGWLASVRFATVAPIREARDTRVLARFSDGTPALVEYEGPARLLVVASDLSNEWNDFVLHPAFVPVVHDLVVYAAARATVPREVLVGDRPGAAAPGVMEVGGARVAVNVDAAEAVGARMVPAAFLAAVPRGGEDAQPPERRAAVRRERDQSLWRYGLMIMLAALVVESAVGRKV